MLQGLQSMLKNQHKKQQTSPQANNSAKDFINKAKQQKQQKTIELINKQKFNRDWIVKIRGPSLANYQFTIITQGLFKIMNKAKDLVMASRQLSQLLASQLGKQYWNVIIVQGPFSKKTYASGGYFVVFQRVDGTQAIIWYNKLTYENMMDKSIVYESQYF